jgi:hypothetical protein
MPVATYLAAFNCRCCSSARRFVTIACISRISIINSAGWSNVPPVCGSVLKKSQSW